MNLCLINNSYKYELEKLIRIFLPFEKIAFFESEVISDRACVVEICEGKAVAKLWLDGRFCENVQEISQTADDVDKECELKAATALYNCFNTLTGYTSSWGLLTGVRPAKLYSRLVKNRGKARAEEYFKNTLLVSEKKLTLCKAANEGEDAITSLSTDNSHSLYISVPFCPTRCSYCSFVSQSVVAAKKLIPTYVQKICEELKYTAKIAKQNKLKLETVYIGGGTPTAISADELAEIMKTVKENFPINDIHEYTVEAGRPDTVTTEKLEVIKAFGATRISINPQTMSDTVLETIGRKHTAEDTVFAFNLARKVGFSNINMDLIAGLPSDTLQGFKATVDKVIALNPESVTVHSLSLKRSSFLNLSGDLPEIEAGVVASQMVDYARETLGEKGIVPYYMYRQSKTVGNLENVGYAKKGYECLYNVYIMDETHTILACGASAVTKLRQPHGDFIERIFNYKYPYEYIEKFDEMLNRKNGVNDFYLKYGKN